MSDDWDLEILKRVVCYDIATMYFYKVNCYLTILFAMLFLVVVSFSVKTRLPKIYVYTGCNAHIFPA